MTFSPSTFISGLLLLSLAGRCLASENFEEDDQDPLQHIVPESHYYTLTLATGYRPEVLCPLLASWKRWEPTSKFVLFVESHERAAMVQAFPGAIVHAVKHPVHMEAVKHRFMIFAEYIKPRVHLMKAILIVDARDSVFNGPFWSTHSVQHTVHRNAVAFCLEGTIADDGKPQPLAIRDQPLNRLWIQECFGPEMATRLEPYSVACAGTTYGAGQAMLEYMLTMARLLTSPATEKCNDQGLHNYVLHKMGPDKELSFVHQIMAPGVGPVYTPGFGFPMDVDTWGVGHVTRTQGGRSHVFTPGFLHQYDRSTRMTALFRQVYTCVAPETVIKDN